MPVGVPPAESWSRRAFVALAAGTGCLAQAVTGRGEVFPSEAKRYFDPTTEFPVVRLTEPSYNSYLPATNNRAVARHNFVLFSSDRGGKLDAYRLDFKSGQSRCLTDAAHLNPASLALLPDDRGFCHIDGATLRATDFVRLRDREIYSATPPFEQLAGVTLTRDGTHAYVVERRPGRDRIRSVPLLHGPAADVLESEDEISAPLPRPAGGVAYRCGNAVCFSDRKDSERALLLAPGKTGPFYWSPDGASLLYLNLPEREGELNSIREHVIASGQDRLIAKTTQFVQFAPNADATVFVGASGSKASPHVLILLRSVRRELTMCEHRARDPLSLAVAFSPNSQRLVFQSDQHGKPALYLVAVERFVSETES